MRKNCPPKQLKARVESEHQEAQGQELVAWGADHSTIS